MSALFDSGMLSNVGSMPGALWSLFANSKMACVTLAIYLLHVDLELLQKGKKKYTSKSDPSIFPFWCAAARGIEVYTRGKTIIHDLESVIGRLEVLDGRLGEVFRKLGEVSMRLATIRVVLILGFPVPNHPLPP